MQHGEVGFNSLPTGKSFRTLFSFTYPNECGDSAFQFPSNGKVLSDTTYVCHEAMIIICFNSLPTGKSFRTRGELEMNEAERRFQFPSNGKVLSDHTTCTLVGET